MLCDETMFCSVNDEFISKMDLTTVNIFKISKIGGLSCVLCEIYNHDEMMKPNKYNNVAITQKM